MKKEISRSEQRPENCWDLSRLYPSDEKWEEDFVLWKNKIDRIGEFKGTLTQSPEKLAEALCFMRDFELLGERLGYYAHLRTTEDVSSSPRQERFSRYMAAATRAEGLSSYQTPEILTLPEEKIDTFLSHPALREFAVSLKKTLRYKPHVLSEGEEKLLALQEEVTQSLEKSFSSLTNADMTFGKIDGTPLTNASFSVFQMNPDREIRRRSYQQFYQTFEAHKNTLADLYSGSVQKDIFLARARNFSSARRRSLFRDDVPDTVYDNLISVVRKNLPLVHRYYEARRKALGVDKLRQYDRIVPLVSDIRTHIPYDKAVNLVLEAVEPLGKEYGQILRKGLTGGWVDRYENKGKSSGAFSAGSYQGDPYILINYQEDNLRDLFTLAHEGGHSMHSWYSVRNNPFQHYNYTIFEAEVASTFNEQLLAHHLRSKGLDGTTPSREMRLYIVNRQIDDFLATMVRQTMFAEFEHKTHAQVEEGRPLTVDSLRGLYRELLTDYFGPAAALEDLSDLEGLRIPHFYRAFYVYKYATGIAASLVLSRRVMEGGSAEKEAYMNFLKSGGSRFPLESLKEAGVDMSSPRVIEEAFQWFEEGLTEMEALLETSKQ